MKLVSALEGGLAGATTISLLTDTLRRINDGSSGVNGLHKKQLGKRFKKAKSKKPLKATKQMISLAGDLLGGTAYLGLSSLGKKKNVLLRGALLGTAAGLGSVLLNGDEKKHSKVNGHEGYPLTRTRNEEWLTKALEVSLYTVGGLIAGKVIQGVRTKKKKNKKRS